MISQSPPCKNSITLTSVNSLGSKHEYTLEASQGVFVGKSSNCGMQLGGDGLSDIHCRIEFDSGKVWVQDWMSNEGTRVNGQSIDNKVEISDTDAIQIGEHSIRLASASTAAAHSAPREPSAESSNELHQSESDLSDQTQAVIDPSIAGEKVSDATDEPIDVAAEEVPEPPMSMEFDTDFFDLEEEDETYDRETVALLHAEIEDLQAQLAQRDAEQIRLDGDHLCGDLTKPEQGSDSVLERMQELIDEANKSDERVALLEEMLFVAEQTNRSEQEERGQLEAWVGDIEKRIGQREDEHKAEADALRTRLEELSQQRDRLQKQLRQAAVAGGTAPAHYEESLENLQNRNTALQEQLAESEKQRLILEQRLEQQSEEQERVLREERVTLAKEQANAARLRFELSKQLTDIEQMPKPENQVDKETAHKIRTLREHLREIHEQEKQKEKEAPIASRLARLWKRVEY